MRRCNSAYGLACFGCVSLDSTPARRHPPWLQRGHGPAWWNSRESPSDATKDPNGQREEASMDLVEITEKERLSREDAAARLHALADALARHNEVEFDRGGLHFKVHVPDEVDFKLEIDIEDDERELEVELTW
jgi:amphi-Trp domain-containing protein